MVHLVNCQHSTCLRPAREGWLDKMANLMDRLYCQETRQVIRLVVLGVLKGVVTSNMVDRVVRVQAVQTAFH